MRRRDFCLRTIFFIVLVLPVSAAAEIRFSFFNVQNFFVTDSSNPAQPVKSQEAIDAVIKTITESAPDILLVCEMGTQPDFLDFQKRLAAAGLKFTDVEFIEGADKSRHLCLLSRYPIVERQSVIDLAFELNGQREYIQRGILDVTIRDPDGKPLRVLGAHLKSRRPVPQGEALLRRHEARLLRAHIDNILEANPDIPLLLAGDLNDTRNEPPILEIQGVRGTAAYLQDIALHDKSGDRWTHFWKTSDTYSRVDYIMVSNALAKRVNADKSGIACPPHWATASDHRLLFLNLR